jgi:hypothetical protein
MNLIIQRAVLQEDSTLVNSFWWPFISAVLTDMDHGKKKTVSWNHYPSLTSTRVP